MKRVRQSNRHFWCIILIFGHVFLHPVKAQMSPDPYRLKWHTEVPLSVFGVGGTGLSEWMKKNKPRLTPEEIAQLDVKSIPAFDRFATRFWSIPAQTGSDVLMYTSMASPLILLIDNNMRKHTSKLALIGLETYLVNAALTSLTKELFKRKRPFVFNPNAPMHKKLGRDATSSYFSGHASASAAASFMTAKMFADYYPNSKYKPYIWTGAALLPAITGFLRVRGGKHYLSDVLTGYAVGALVGVMVPQLHKKK